MSHVSSRWTATLAVAAAMALGVGLTAWAAAPQATLKARKVAPKAAAIDEKATVDTLLAQPNVSDWSPEKGATLEGYVVQVVRSEDGDMRLSLASAKDEPDTRKWVIVEVKPAWAKKVPSLAPAKVWKLQGQKIRATGWLFFDEPAVKYPRGTNWELHPVTQIVPVK